MIWKQRPKQSAHYDEICARGTRLEFTLSIIQCSRERH